MADPFSISPPAWLVNVAKPVNGEELGRTFAMGLSTLATAFEEDPNAKPDASWLDSRKGFSTAAAEVSSAQLDPQWRVKGQLLANQVASQKMQLAEQGAWLNAQQKETSAWMNELPEVSSYLTTPPDKLDGVDPPKVTSQRGIQAITAKQQQIESYKLRKAQQENTNAYRQSQVDVQRDKIEHGANFQKHQVDIENAYFSLPPAERAQIDNALGNNLRTKQGYFSNNAEAMIADALQRNKMPGIGQKVAGKFSPEVQDEIKEVDEDMRDVRRRIDQAVKDGRSTDDLDNELSELKARRQALRSNQPIASTGSTRSDAIDKKTEHELHQAQVAARSGKKSDRENLKAVEKKIQEQKQTAVLDAEGELLPTDVVERDAMLAKHDPSKPLWDPVRGIDVYPDTTFFDKATKTEKLLLPELIAEAQKSVADRKVRDEARKKKKDEERRQELEQMGSAWMKMGTMGGL